MAKQYRIRKFISIRYSALHKNVRDLAIYGKGATNLKNVYVVSGPNCEVGDCKKNTTKNVLIAGGDHSAAMKNLSRTQKTNEGIFILEKKNVTYTSKFIHEN